MNLGVDTRTETS